MHPRLKILALLIVVLGLAVSLAIVMDLRRALVADKAEEASRPSAAAVTSTAAVLRSSAAFFNSERTSADGVTKIVIPAAFDGMQALSDGFMFYGTSTAFENVLAWRLQQIDGVVIASGTASVQSPDTGIPGPFTVKVSYGQTPNTEQGVLDVFEASAKDGTPLHEVRIPVVLATSTQGIIQP